MFKLKKKKSFERPIFTVEKAPFHVIEAYKAFRANILFASVGRKVKKIVFTSANPAEGKTSVSVNLAISLGQAGHKVLLIDSDLRKPRIHKLLELPSSPGLTNILVKANSFKETVNKTKNGEIDVITCGPIPPNPSELLGSKEMDELLKSVEQDYDYIIMDTPPSLFMSDAAVLSKFADGVVIITLHGKTTFDMVEKVKDNMEKAGANILGCILNDVKVNSDGRYNYRTKYGHYAAYYDYYNEDGK